MPKFVGIILARMGSTRLPGKSLANVVGKQLIVHLIERLERVNSLDQIILATPDSPADVPLQEAGCKAGAEIFAGSEEDVLDRLYQAARSYSADVIVHVGGDCPFVDPALVKTAIDLLKQTDADYVCNILPMTYPSGMDIDVLTFTALERAWQSATLRIMRRHPFAYIYQNQDEFHIENFAHEPNLGHMRWTLDYPEDLDFVRAVYERLYPSNPYFGMESVLALLAREPQIGRINFHLSEFINTQPAYWDSEGYLSDLRIDVRNALNNAIAADEAADLATAADLYKVVQKLLSDLYERASLLSAR